MSISENIDFVENVDSRMNQYLTFILSEEEYCVELAKIQQVVSVDYITKVPLSSPSILGVINLRGKAVPVIDLRVKFDMKIVPPTSKSCFVILNITENAESFLLAFFIDEVHEVVTITDDMIAELPEFGNCFAESYLSGVAKIGNSMRMILDIDKLFSHNELALFDSSQE